jgi:predicted transcriptional regulator
MPDALPPLPTDAELRVLRALWGGGPATVRDVQARLNQRPGREAGYTTVLKHLQIMLEKGLVERDESQRAHVYRAATSERSAQRRLVDDLAERAFGGSARKLVQRALSTEQVSAEERDEIRALLDRLGDEDASDDRRSDAASPESDDEEETP